MTHTINSTEPMPPVPHGANGRWEWDGRSRARQIDLNGQEWFLKGRWKWIANEIQKQDAFTERASIEQIVTHFKPVRQKIKIKDDFAIKRIEKILYATTATIIATVLVIMFTL